MFRHLSKITASTIKYTSSLFSQEDHSQDYISPKLIELWLQDMQTGLDALFNDQLILAEDTFSTHTKSNNQQSPFHAFGLGLLIYSKAMLAMEKTKIDEAIEYILELETTLKRTINHFSKKKRRTTAMEPAGIHSSFSVPQDIHLQQQQDGIELHFELLHANCILMSATLQFLRDSWIDNIKAAYDLRKAYKIYQYLFQTMIGISIEEYELQYVCIKVPAPRRTVSCDNSNSHIKYNNMSTAVYDETIAHGAYFGIGLFNIIFSILPSKVGKILNSLGFHSSRSTAVYLLLKSYNSQTMYSSLSSLVLLSFYTNISIYIQPNVNQFFHYKDAKMILDDMNSRYPNGPIWSLLEGKFKKLQGTWDQQSISLIKKVKQHHAIEKDGTVNDKDYFRNISVTEFTQFRTFVMYELGWSYIYAGDYFQASESFFCLESMCNWSRIFYHYISTCCMIADGLFDKAVLETRQIINMLDQKKKLNNIVNSNENYAESRVRHWIEISTQKKLSLRDTLKYKIVNPIWELVYLWNGVTHWKYEIVMDIKQHILEKWKTREEEDLMLYILMGVIERDVEKKNDKALEYFHFVLKCNTHKQQWIIPYAMYEIAVSYFNILLLSRKHMTEYKLIIMEWIKSIEKYYIEQSSDMVEWETRMQIRCQLLIESCNNIL